MKTRLFPMVACVAFSLFIANLRAGAPILENSRVRAQLDKMQGKPAPKLALKGWINAKPMSL